MRVDLDKYVFVGMEKGREDFFKDAQITGIIDFIRDSETPVSGTEADIFAITSAIKILRGLPPTEQEEMDNYPMGEGIAHKIVQLQHRIDKLHEEIRVNRLEKARVSVFGNFSIEEVQLLEKEGNRVVQYYYSKAGVKDEIELPDSVIFIATDHGLDYFMAINKEPMQFERLVEMKIPHPIGELKKQEAALKQELHDTEVRLKHYAKYNAFLHNAFIYKMNTYNLQQRQGYAAKAMDGDLFSVQGWVPDNKKEELKGLLDRQDVFGEQVAIEPTETPPTYLENQGFDRIGEDLVHIYDTPSNTDKDPSFWVLCFFALFFAMIVGDAGYGLVFLAVAGYIYYKNRKMKPSRKRLWWLLVILGSATVFWGLMTTSLFGIHISHDNPIRKVSLIRWLVEKKAEYHFNHKDKVYEYWVKQEPNLKDAKNGYEFLHGAAKEEFGIKVNPMISKFSDNILLELALLVGVIHLCVSFARYLDRNWQGVGWIIAIIGAYLFIPSFIEGTSIVHFVTGWDVNELAKTGKYMMIGGFSLAVVLSLIRHKWMGILEPMHVIQIFADVMSYLRLYALGFAGVVVAETINGFASGMNIFFAAILFLLGHLTNMVLAIMGGVIHGLRLNFLEWYHYSFEGGGKNFNPLRKQEYD